MGIVQAFVGTVFAGATRAGRARQQKRFHHHVPHGSLHVGRNLLDHSGNPQAGLLDDLAGLQIHFVCKHLQQGALAATVSAHQANPVSGLDIKAHVVQQGGVRPDAQKQVLCRKNGHAYLLILFFSSRIRRTLSSMRDSLISPFSTAFTTASKAFTKSRGQSTMSIPA